MQPQIHNESDERTPVANHANSEPRRPRGCMPALISTWGRTSNKLRGSKFDEELQWLDGVKTKSSRADQEET